MPISRASVERATTSCQPMTQFSSVSTPFDITSAAVVSLQAPGATELRQIRITATKGYTFGYEANSGDGPDLPANWRKMKSGVGRVASSRATARST